MTNSGFHFSGIVVTGDGEAGIAYGIPTANLNLTEKPEIDIGVYAATVELDGQTYYAAVCWGPENKPKFEVHLLNFSDDIVGKKIRGEIKEKISEFVALYSTERLRQKILHDIDMVKKYFNFN
ncbi:hypothetical protein D6827_00540 [Candidatus Parcubacteria bacterium]|nr:MAG: hypothetical protein D6827_00540 [Candidatus Parcubacteria bacterium]